MSSTLPQPQDAPSEPTPSDVDEPRDEGGFVLVTFAVILVALMAMAGFGIDVWSWWYGGQQAQRAADAAALSGVVFMPEDFPGATSAATSNASSNGFASGVTVSQTLRPNQLQVKVTTTVTNKFTALLGIKTTSITRSATAEYTGKVAMGSPDNKLGNDPENPPTSNHWLNLAATGAGKLSGDRYAAQRCNGGGYLCPGSATTDDNPEYNPDSYYFNIDVPASATGSALTIQAFDPELAVTNTCNTNMPSAAELTTLSTTYPDANTRYGSGFSLWCTNDDNTNAGESNMTGPQTASFIVRSPDITPSPEDNPVISGCTKQYRGRNEAVFPLLNPASGTYDANFAGAFHRWATLCTINAPVAGRYVVQVKSSVPLGAANPENDASASDIAAARNTYGMNRYSLRAGALSGGTMTANGVALFAEERLPIYANSINSSATPEFYLARVLPGSAAGRTVRLTFYDIGDVAGGNTNIEVESPTDATIPITSCTWRMEGGAMPASSTIAGCKVSGIVNGDYNGHLVTADISIPPGYNCSVNLATGCWIKIKMSYDAGVTPNDTTTWAATIVGDPVRIVK